MSNYEPLGFSNMTYDTTGLPLTDTVDMSQSVDSSTSTQKKIIIQTKKPFPWWILVVAAAYLYLNSK